MKPLEPMLATLAAEPFHLPGWVYEEKYDGIRGVAVREKKTVRLWSRNLIDRTANFPKVAQALAALPDGDLMLDGELVFFDPSGISRFQLWGAGEPAYMVFDVLYLHGRSVMDEPLSKRRALLEKLIPAKHDVLRLSRRLEQDGLAAYAYAKEHDWEGIIAKDDASVYEPGRRARTWLKVKVRRESEFVIGGYTAPKGSREGFGALLVGLFDGPQLRYCGKVGTGFTAKLLLSLLKQMKPQPASPFRDAPRFRDATWVKPELVAQLAFHEWTGDGKLRHPAFLGLREDKAASEVTWAGRER